MWIAFKNYYLRDYEQPNTTLCRPRQCCELLSKIIIFVITNNPEVLGAKDNLVVNCFQKLLSSWLRTTAFNKSIVGDLLWIAFKNYYLRDYEQLAYRVFNWQLCCELLSKIIIFVITNNNVFSMKNLSVVVNCFQKLLSSWLRTTFGSLLNHKSLLWIAFKNYYLRDYEQRCC